MFSDIFSKGVLEDIASREHIGMGDFVMSEKKKDEDKKGIYEPAYAAFLPIGIAFLTLSFTLDNMWAFLPVGIVFFIIGISYGIPWQRINDKNTQTDNTADGNVSTHNDSKIPDTSMKNEN